MNCSPKVFGRGREGDYFPRTNRMDPDYRAMLLAVLARTTQLIAEIEAIMRESTNSDTVDGAIVQLAELRRLMADVESKLSRPEEN